MVLMKFAHPAAIRGRHVVIVDLSSRVAMYRAYVDADARAWASKVCGL